MRGRAGALLLAVALGAGLLTGLSRFPGPMAVTIALVLAAAVADTVRARVMAATALLGAVVGSGIRSGEAGGCAATWHAGSRTAVLELVDPGIGVGRARSRSECAGEVMVRWREGAIIPAGATVSVTGRWRPDSDPVGRPRGLLLVSRHEVVAPPVGGFLAKSRTAVAVAIRERFGEHAGVVDALVAGRRGAIDREIRDSFAATGLVHLLSISGFHVGLVIAWIVMGWSLTGRPSRQGEMVGAGVGLLYAAWLGWPPPATRAAVMAAVAVAARSRQRNLRFDGVIGLAALAVLMIDPAAVVDLGAWLSFAAMAGVVWLPKWVRQAMPNHRPLVAILASSVGATMATAPIAAAVIGTIAPIGVLLNLVAIPIAAAAVPGALMALAFHSLMPMVAEGFAVSTGLLLDLLELVARIGAALPGAAGVPVPGLAAALPWTAALAAAIWATAGRSTVREAGRRAAWSLAVWLWAGLVIPLAGADRSGGLTIHFVDVGQGDAMVLRTPAGRWLVVDAGPIRGRYDAGRQVVVPFLASQRAPSITMLVVTHSHLDHFGGAPAIMERFPIGVILDPGVPYPDSGYAGWLDRVVKSGVPWRVVGSGESWRVDDVTVTVVHPDPTWSGSGGNPNEDSIVLLVEYRGFRALLTGDAGFPAESLFAARAGKIDLLKVGHHGSRYSTGEQLLRETAPSLAVISSGENDYGHPAPEVIRRLEEVGAAVWRNDREGTISVRTDGRTITVRGGRTTATYPVRTSEP